MSTLKTSARHHGFTLIEVMAAVAIFVIVCSAMFSLLNTSQQRYQSQSQILSSFQDARLTLDQITRDANDAGYPPSGNFSVLPAACIAGNSCLSYVDSPIAWNPTYTTLTPCTIGGTCVTPTGFDVIFEENPNGAANNVQWIRYRLVGTTLFRGWALKTAGDPAATTLPQMVPYLTNVMNNATAAQIAKFNADYPSMFPGGNPQPIFQYYCSNPAGPAATVLCPAAAGNIPLANGTVVPASSPLNVVDVEITLIVQTTQIDPKTKAPLLVELNGFGHRVNPN